MLTAIVLTHNEERHLPDCLASLAWAPQVIVFDSFSTDLTVEIARAAGATLLQRAFDNYSGQRNAALAAAGTEWVLFVDADERVPPELREEIEGALARPEAGWWIPRHNYIFGRLTRHTGWYPDYQLRLLRRAKARYENPVHEVVVLGGEAGYLKHPFIHLNYESVREFIAKQKYYATYDAQKLRAEGVAPALHKFVLQPLRQFWRRFVSLGGWRDGLHGLRLSVLMAWFEFETYRQLRNIWLPTSAPRG